MASQDNLMAAFAGESQANRKYLAYAAKAEKDGFPQVARLFRAAADAETVHALAHFRTAGNVKDTIANLKDAIAGEAHESNVMYPEFVVEAEKEGAVGALRTFSNALAVEKVHHNLYEAALAAVEGGSDLPERKIYVCPVCGYTVYEEDLCDCPVCGVPAAKFSEVK
ncbi:MAG: rubrerythrin family protein [Phycisphaerae bacterium]